jgi:hypothetical protein
VLGAGRDDDGDTVLELVPFPVQDRDALAGLHADELVVALVLFEADFLAGLQGHDDQLAALRRVKDLPKIIPGKRFFFDIDAVTRHGVLHKVVVQHCIGMREPARNIVITTIKVSFSAWKFLECYNEIMNI